MDAMQVIAEPKRRKILALVWDQELTASDIAAQFDVTFGAVSQHLGVLRDAKFVAVRAEGNRRYYRADHDALGPFRGLLESMWGDTLSSLAATIESDQGRDVD